jgi:hypothetical protein
MGVAAVSNNALQRGQGLYRPLLISSMAVDLLHPTGPCSAAAGPVCWHLVDCCWQQQSKQGDQLGYRVAVSTYVIKFNQIGYFFRTIKSV